MGLTFAFESLETSVYSADEETGTCKWPSCMRTVGWSECTGDLVRVLGGGIWARVCCLCVVLVVSRV